MNKVKIKDWDALQDRESEYALVGDVDLVVTWKEDMGRLSGVAFGGVGDR